MAKPGRMKEIEREYALAGENVIDVVIRVLNTERSIPKAARVLNISDHNLFLWVKEQKIEKHVCWVKPD